jgi:acyl-CoA synthetase (AMP-forming)/AMP-acid ligase II
MTTAIRRFPDLLKVRATHQPDDLAHDDTRRTLTFAQWDREADEIGGGLAAAGLAPGDRVFLPISNKNAVEMAVAALAVMRAGAIVCPVNTRLSPTEVSDYHSLVEPRFCITNAPDILAGLKFEGLWSVDEMPRDIEALPDQAGLPEDGDMEILMTSGTTGRAKGVVISNEDLIQRSDGVARDRNTGTLHALPFTGSGGNLGTMTAPIRGGAPSYTQPQFDPQGFCELVEQKRPQTIYLVPSMLRLLLNLPHIGDYDFGSVKHVLSGTAPLPHDSVIRTTKLWPHVRMRNSYGMSEGGIGVSTRAEEVKKPGCVGKLPPHMQVRDEDGNPTKVREVGEIFGKAGKARRYWNDPEGSARGWVDGWTRTGDLGYVDEDGDLIICGRSKELIIRGGYNITPLEIETVLFDHPAVKDAAVVGVPHDVLGEDIAAGIVLRDGEHATAEDLQVWCRGKLADNKVPRTITFFEAFPYNASGKVLKRELAPALEAAAKARKTATA